MGRLSKLRGLGSESWVTSVQDDEEALQAWALAISFRNVRTAKKLSAIVSGKVSEALNVMLRTEFHLIVDEPKESLATSLGGMVGWRVKPRRGQLLKFWTWTLTAYTKCVYIPPSCLVLENVDSLFGVVDAEPGHGDLCPLHVFRPSLHTFKHAVQLWNQTGGGLDSRWSGLVGVEGMNDQGRIVGYSSPPWTMEGWMDGEWGKIYGECICPQIQGLEEGTVKSALAALAARLRLPTNKPGPANPLGRNIGPTGTMDPPIGDDSISVIGLSVRFAGANNADELWALLAGGGEGVGPFPEGRPNTVGDVDVDGIEGGYLRCAVDEFDAKFFGISPREASYVDPQQRLLLEVIWEALESAGIPPASLKDTETGAYLGIWQQDYEAYIGTRRLGAGEFHYRYLGNAFSATSSRISYFLGLTGPNVAVESGCSSSLAALHLAVQALRSGKISLAISSGVNLVLGTTKEHMKDDNTIVLSKDYRCKTFDAGANGFVRAEGVGTLILKRTADALRDGDNIMAVIRGSALNNDGAGTSFGTPNADSQEKVIRMALADAGVAPAQVSYVEAHGTGTAVGDPIEMAALSRVYAEGRNASTPLLVGSVKTNIGHAESAAGVAGLTKVILAFKHHQIPPHRNLKTLNPHIDLSLIPAVIPSALTDWELRSGVTARLASVSSFGMTGTNVHVVLQEPPPQLAKTRQKADRTPAMQLLTISAKSPGSLQALASSYAVYCTANPGLDLAELAYTVNAARGHNFQHRLALTAPNLASAASALERADYVSGKASGTPPKVGFLFTGQGCGYVGMGAGLYATSPPFAAAFDRCSVPFEAATGLRLASVLWPKNEDASRLNSTALAQPSLFCLQIALLSHWKALGVVPSVVLGHSVGEFAASVACGLLTVEQALSLVVERSRLVGALSTSAMLVLKCGEGQVKSLLDSFYKTHAKSKLGGGLCWVDVAAVNSPSEVVVSGQTDTLASLAKFAVNNGVGSVPLASSHAFHSRAMEPILAEFEEAVGRVLGPLRTQDRTDLSATFISGSRGHAVEAGQLLDVSYWTAHLRRPVRFAEAAQLIVHQVDILVEIGPQPILLPLALANLESGQPKRAEPPLCVPSLRKPRAGAGKDGGDWGVCLDAAASLYVNGVDLDWGAWFGLSPRPRKLTDLPTYAFERERHWYTQQDGDEYPSGGPMWGKKQVHPLLGSVLPVSLPETIYTVQLSPASHPYLDHHRIGGKVILPGAIYLEASLAAGRELLGWSRTSSVPTPLTIQNLSIECAVEVPSGGRGMSLQTVVHPLQNRIEEMSGPAPLAYSITFHRPLVAGQTDVWKRTATASFLPVSQPTEERSWEGTLSVEELKARLTHRHSLTSMYDGLAETGLEFGPSFRSIRSAWTSATEILSLIQLPEDTPAHNYICHPIILDGMIQTLALGSALESLAEKDSKEQNEERGSGWLRLPLTIRRFTWMGRSPQSSTLYAYSSSLRTEDGVPDGKGEDVVCLYDEDGVILAVFEGLELIRVSVDSFLRAIRAEANPVPDFYREVWVERLGLSGGRMELGNALAALEGGEGKTAAKRRAWGDDETRGSVVLGRHKGGMLCFYYMVKGLQEAGWEWPEKGTTLPPDFWKRRLTDCTHLRNTRAHSSFLAALATEGYLEAVEVRGGVERGGWIVRRPLPSVVAAQAEIEALQSEIPALLPDDHTGFQFAVRCGEQFGRVINGGVSPLSVLFPSDGDDAVGALRYYLEAQTFLDQADYTVAAFADLISDIKTANFTMAMDDRETEAHAKAEKGGTRDKGGRVEGGRVLRILEVGGGSGETSRRLIKLLVEEGLRFEYTFTDISFGFLNKAEGSLGPLLGGGGALRTRLLDIELDPLAQGFCPGNYDVVLAVQVLHATRDLNVSLRHLRRLLRPQGLILITEQFSLVHMYQVSWALLDGWWRFDGKDGRAEAPIVSGPDWLKLLDANGFDQAAVVHSDESIGYGLVVGRAATPTKTYPTEQTKQDKAQGVELVEADKTWVLFGPKSTLALQVGSNLAAVDRKTFFVFPGVEEGEEGNGVRLDFGSGEAWTSTFQGILRPRKQPDGSEIRSAPLIEGVVYFCCGDPKRAEDPQQSMLEAQKYCIGGLLHFFQTLTTLFGSEKERPKVFVVSRGIHVLGDGGPGTPTSATAWGATRCFVNEVPGFTVAMLDLDQDEPDNVDNVDKEVRELSAAFWRTGNGEDPIDKFLAIRSGKLYAHSLVGMERPSPPLTLPSNTGRFGMVNPPSGSFADIEIGGETVRTGRVSGRMVEVAVEAVALNFRDLFCILKPPGFEKFFEADAAGNYDVGSDISGVVVSVGEGVTRFAPGDAVFGMTEAGGLRSHTFTDERTLMRKPANWTHLGAATLPVVFLTSYYSLVELGGLKSTDRVLVHVATGGVGLAAIQIAQRIGATIFATAGSRRKRAYLRTLLGVRHVYNSRNLDFGPAIMADTGGEGVDVILNSLTGPGFKETSLAASGPGARFIEIGKLGIWSAEEVACLRPDVAYHFVNLGAKEPAVIQRVSASFTALEEAFQAGTYKPLPSTVFPLERLRDAFYYFQEAKHIGKIVVRMPSLDSSLLKAEGRLVLVHHLFNPESSYLVTGGLGGLGLEVTKWMCASGAKTIVLAGRNPPSPSVQTFLQGLTVECGARIVCSVTDVGRFEDVSALLQKIVSDGLPPLRGIFHSAGILADATLPNQTWDKFDSVFHPKVYGAWWLHTLTLHYDLEFFTMFSSVAAIVGMMGQAPHAAASRFLDSLAAYRSAMGLPAATINWGPWSDVGAAANLKVGLERLVGVRFFTPAQGIAALDAFMRQNYTSALVVDVPDWTVVQSFVNLGSFFHDLESMGKGGAGNAGAEASAAYTALAAEIQSCAAEERASKIQDYLERVIKQTLRLPPSDPVDPDENFTSLGVDSLMAMEMRNRLQALLIGSGKTLSINAMQENRTLRSISAHLADLINSTEEGTVPPTLLELIQKDAELPEDIREAIVGAVVANKSPPLPTQYRTVLLTGATGFLGSRMLAQLFTTTNLSIVCLVRAGTRAEGMARLRDSFAKFRIEDGVEELSTSARLHVVCGQVDEEWFGLGREEYEMLADSVDAVIHLAIKVNHLEEYGEGSSLALSSCPSGLRAQNVGGVLQVLRFVLARRAKAFVHASSLLAVTKWAESGELEEEFPTLADYTPLLRNGYSVSKFVTEILIGEAVRCGLRGVTVIRYPSIWGHSVSGFMSPDNTFNHGWALLTTCVRSGKFPHMNNEGGFAMVCVDTAASITLHLLLRGGGEYGVVNMTTETACTEAVLERVMAERKLPVQFMPMAEWRRAVLEGRTERGGVDAFAWLYGDDDEGFPRLRASHPLFAVPGGGGSSSVGVRVDVISKRMRSSLGDQELELLRLSAYDVLNAHLDYSFTHE